MLKSMASKKKMMMGGDDVVANVGYSKEGLVSQEPEYPYCLKLYLGPEELEALELKEMPALGSGMSLMAKVKVVGMRMEKDYPSLEVQITDMALIADKKEKSPVNALYGENEESENED